MDVLDWMPPELSVEERAAFAEQHPDDDHAAAAAAWEAYAATLPISGHDGVKSVATGAQSITYNTGGGAHAQAMSRANWHRSRSRARSVALGPTYGAAVPPTDLNESEPSDQVTPRAALDDRLDAWGRSTVWTAQTP